MRTGDLAQLLETFITRQIPMTPCLWGSTGIGKSTIPKQVAKKLGYKVFDIRLSQLESVDIKGMPFTCHTTVTVPKDDVVSEIKRMRNMSKVKHTFEKYGITVKEEITKENLNSYLEQIPEYVETELGTLSHYSPDWFVKAMKEGKCILFLDELNRARTDVLQAAFELVLDRTINNTRLPDDVFILVACNPSTANYDTNPIEDDALKARFMHLKITPNSEDWIEWAGQTNDEGNKRIHPNVLAHILSSPQDLNFKKDDEDGSIESWVGDIHPIPRRWEMVSMLEEKAGHLLPDNILAECFLGLLGGKMSTKYFAQRKTSDKPISLKELLEWSKETQERVKRYSGISSTSAKDSKKKGATKEDFTVRPDLLNETIRDMMNNWSSVIQPDNHDKLVEFFTIIPKELSTKAMGDMIKRMPEMSHDKNYQTNMKTFLKKCGAVKELYDAIQRLATLREL